MSAKSMIYVKVREEDIGTSVTPDKNLIYAKGLRISDIGGDEVIPDSEVDKVPHVQLDGQYIGIYHHWDGFPSNVGRTLVTKFNTYKEALNLMLYGDESDITEGSVIIPYLLRGGGYKKQADTPPEVCNKIPSDLKKSRWVDYVYLFKEGEWYYDTASCCTSKKYRWKKLKEYLEKRKIK